MKVWEYINQLKGTVATKETIRTWAYMNRITPCDFDTELDLNDKHKADFQENTTQIILRLCDSCENCIDCLNDFLESEI